MAFQSMLLKTLDVSPAQASRVYLFDTIVARL